MSWSDQEAREHVARAEALLARLDTLPDPDVREQVAETLAAVVALYGEGLARVLRHADDTGAAALAGDELVGHLLLVHDLHPEPADARVRRALGRVRAAGGAELVALDGRVARVGLRARGCASSAEATRQEVRDAVGWAAPEIDRVEFEEEAAPMPLIAVDSLFRAGAGSGR